MRKVFCTLAITLTLLSLISVGGFAQEFKIDLSASVPFGPEGLDIDGAGFSLAGATSFGDINLKAKMNMGIAGFSKATLTLNTNVADLDATGEVNLTAEGFDGATISFAKPIDVFRTSTTFIVSAAGLESGTFTASAQTDGGGSFRGSVTLTPQGFSRHVVTFGLEASGFSISRTTVLTTTGLAQESWTARAQLGDVSISRTSVFDASGFVSDTMSASTNLNGYDISKSATFTTEGFAGMDVSVSGTVSDISFASKMHLEPSLAWTEQFTVNGAFDRINYSLGASLNPDGFQGGSLSASTSFVLNEEQPEGTSESSGE